MANWRDWRVPGVAVVSFLCLLQVLFCGSSLAAPSTAAAPPLDGCAHSIWKLFPPDANVTRVTKWYASADERIRRIFPDVSTSGSYTIFLSIDTALSLEGSFKGPANQLQNLSDAEFTSWLLYNMLPVPMPVDQIGLARRVPTMLSRATALDVYDLRTILPANFAFGGRVELFDLMGDQVSILASFPICNSWVHTIDGILWPATRANISAIPDPVPGGSLDGTFVPPAFPNPSSIGSLAAQLPNPMAGLPNPPAGLPNPATGQQVVQKVVSAVTAGISGVVNSISSNGENQPPLPGPGGLPALPGQEVTASGEPPSANTTTLAGPNDGGAASKTPAIIGGVIGGLAVVLLVVGLVMGAALHHRKSTIVMVRPTSDSMTKGNSNYHTPRGFYSTGSGMSIAGADAKVSTVGIGDGGVKDSASSVDGGFPEGSDPELGMEMDDYYAEMYRSGRTGNGDVEEAGPRAEWEVPPEDITICKDAYGRDWQLGSGGFGSVYRATLQGSTPVAVKFVSGHSPKEQTRFRNEVDILKGLRHTNVVQFLGASLAAGQIMLVTEYLPRGDLWRALSNDAAHLFNWYNRGRQVSLDIVRGLQYMHSKKIMHLDLKSANILLARDGSAKIADVGLAKILTRDNTHVSMEGTFDWAAPEVLAGQEVSEKCDIWSLGVVLWEIVTGERPHLRQLRPVRVPEECPEEVEAVIMACRRMDPAQRPTAREVYEVLSRSPSRQNSVVQVDRNNSTGTACIQGPWSSTGAVSVAPRQTTSTTSSTDEVGMGARRPPLCRVGPPAGTSSTSEENAVPAQGAEQRGPGRPSTSSVGEVEPGDGPGPGVASQQPGAKPLDTGQPFLPPAPPRIGRPVIVVQAAASPFASATPGGTPFLSPREHEEGGTKDLADCKTHVSAAQSRFEPAPLDSGKPAALAQKVVGAADAGSIPVGRFLVRQCSSISEEPGIQAVQGSAPSALPKQTSLGRQLPNPTPSPFSMMTIGGVLS